MKKLTGLFLLLVLASSAFAAIQKNVKYVPAKEYKPFVDKQETTYTPNQLNDLMGENAIFDQSANGYGWYQGGAPVVSYDDVSGTYCTVYRQFHPSGSGTLGATVFNPSDWTQGTPPAFNNTTIIPQSDDFRGRYPSIVSKYGYHFVLANNFYGANSDESHGIYMVYDAQNDVWSDMGTIPLLEKAWGGVGDITYNETTGEYVFVTSWGTNGESTTRSFSIVIGKTTDPMDPDSWIWSDPADMTYIENVNAVEIGYQPIFTWAGEDGFGILTLIADWDGTGQSGFKPGYLYTTDFASEGSWSNNGDFTVIDIYGEDIFGRLNDPVTVEGTTEFITKHNINMAHTTAGIVNNGTPEVHLGLHVKMATDQDNVVLTNDDDEPAMGFWNLIFKKEGDTVSYETNYIASFVGWLDEESHQNQHDNRRFYGQYYNSYPMSFAKFGNSDKLIFSALDRPQFNAVDPFNPPFSFPGLQGGQFPNHVYVPDAYIIASLDNGRTWNYDETEINGDVPPFAMYNMTDTNEQPAPLCEEGFMISLNNPEDESVVYAAYQYAQLDNPIQPDPEDFCDHQQNLVLHRIGDPFSLVDIGEEPGSTIAEDFTLAQNYPNPFNPETTISFNLKDNSFVNLTVYNAQGAVVENLVENNLVKGAYKVNFNAANYNSGVYFYKLNVNGITATKKMVLMK